MCNGGVAEGFFTKRPCVLFVAIVLAAHGVFGPKKYKNRFIGPRKHSFMEFLYNFARATVHLNIAKTRKVQSELWQISKNGIVWSRTYV